MQISLAASNAKVIASTTGVVEVLSILMEVIFGERR
jgi:hypothetical protein